MMVMVVGLLRRLEVGLQIGEGLLSIGKIIGIQSADQALEICVGLTVRSKRLIG